MFTPLVKARAVCDPGNFEVADRINDQPFLVTVEGETMGGEPLPTTRYEIAAPTERVAAFDGIERFVRQHSRPN